MVEQQAPSPPRFKRRQIYVHSFQRTYAIKLGLFLFSYCFVLFGLAFVLPYILPAIKLLSPGSVEERASAGTQLLSLVENLWPTLLEMASTVWPALLALVLAAAVFSIYLTHRVAGPLYRFQKCTTDLAEGNLAMRIRLRDGDDLQDLAEVVNKALEKIDQAMAEIRGRTASMRQEVRTALDGLKTQGHTDQKHVDRLERADQEGQEVEEVFKRFRLSASNSESK